MVTTGRGNEGACVLSSLDYRRFILTVLMAYLMTTSSCFSSLTKDRKPTAPGGSLLNSAINEFDDALRKLKQFAESRAEAEFVEDPQAESFERNSRDEDYRQEPELVPGLDRFEKNLDESEHGPAKTQASPENNKGISLEDLIELLKKNTRDKQKEEASDLEDVRKTPDDQSIHGRDGGQSEGHRRPPPADRAASSGGGLSKDITLNDLLDFLRERKNKEKQDSASEVEREFGGKSEENIETRGKSDISDGSLKNALEYLASLKKKMGEEKARQSQ